MSIEIKATEVEVNGKPVYGINLINSEFSDIMYHYGEVKFLEDEPNDRATLAFEYVILEGTEPEDPETKKRFQEIVGDVLIEVITRQLDTHEVVFKGGTDSEDE